MFKFFLLFLLSLCFVTSASLARVGVKLGTDIAMDLAHRYVVGKATEKANQKISDYKQSLPKPAQTLPTSAADMVVKVNQNAAAAGAAQINKLFKKKARSWIKEIANSI
ncbi:hypothetical protein K502DRAFT_342075 [Neoconidiobolus thromboides FSU 785]|nr:hypothetical protein K502DRAFT_342075 [Neoconidiobolus thromboides FSU 785]